VAALASLRIRPWPFPGAIGIREPGVAGVGTVLHIVDRWQHLGTAEDDRAVAALLEVAPAEPFDPDSYRIIARCLERVAPRDLVMLPSGRD
jgi:DNA polymerase-3 subunit epsilon